MQKPNDLNYHDLTHDINSTVSSLIGALEVVGEAWRDNPLLVDKILPLTLQKITLLQEQLKLYHHQNHQ